MEPKYAIEVKKKSIKIRNQLNYELRVFFYFFILIFFIFFFSFTLKII